MHFRITDAFTYLFVFLSILPIASPLPSSPRTNVAENGLDLRQLNIIYSGAIFFAFNTNNHKCANMSFQAIISSIVEDVIKAIIIDIIDFDKDAHAAETNFTQQTVISLGNQYPDKNRLVFHDQDSTYNFCKFCLSFLVITGYYDFG
jgi:hypothetical protein